MASKSSLLSLLALSQLGLGCERRIDLGQVDASGEGGSGSASGGAVPELMELVFSSDFETGDLSEWGVAGATLETAGGSLTVDSLLAHGGVNSLLVTTAELKRHVVLSESLNYQEVRFGFWLRVDGSYETLNWVLLNVDADTGAGLDEIWDLGIEAFGDGTHRVFLWDKVSLISGGDLAGQAQTRFSVGEWVHLEFYLLASEGDDGFVQVIQNEKPVIELRDRPTSVGGPLQFGLGSYATALSPLPAQISFDDVVIYAR